jgi:type VI secretion system protein ImpE
MKAEEFIKSGQLDEALSSLQAEVRANPVDARLRTYLFQLYSVLGQWEKANTQLKVLADMNSETLMLARIFQPVLHGEAFRKEVFSGNRTALIFGEPMEWMGLLLQANELAAKSKFIPAQELRDKAFEAAPATSGKFNDTSFEWIADADTRLGPILEVMMNGSYYWVPFCRIKKMALEPPTDLRDLVWAPAQFLWTNGGEASGHVPVRYPGTEASTDSGLRLGRKTEWQEKDGGYAFGVGQRVLATSEGDFSLLECRTLEFNHPE